MVECFDVSKEINIIAAVSENGVIGRENKLPWHIPEDLKRFRELTMGNIIIMGRKTFESIGKALPGRVNIVITRDEQFSAPGCIVCRSLEDALRVGQEQKGKIFIIGGAQIFEEAIEIASKLYLTVVEDSFEGDARFPDYSAFGRVAEDERGESKGLKYKFLILER